MTTRTKSSTLGRRDFSRLVLGAGTWAASRAGFAADVATPPFTLTPPFPTDDTDIKIKTPDGICDAAVIRPERGAYPCVLMWPDAMGLRPEMREVAKRISEEGYQVLMPNPYYRTATAAAALEMKGKDREKLYAPLTQSGVVELDASVFIAYVLNMIPDTKGGMVGAIGYGQGGAYALRTAAAETRRVQVLVALHAGNTLPLDAVKYMKAHTFIGMAADDDQKSPAYKDTVKKAFAAAGNPADVEVYAGTKQGFCIPGSSYNKAVCDKATAKTIALLRQYIIVGSANPGLKL